jgi:hypothetical protein
MKKQIDSIIKRLTDINIELIRDFGTDAYEIRCKIYDTKEELSKLPQPTVMRSKLMADAQKKREDECGDHYFIEDGKWSSTRTCQDCGKRI